MAQQRMCVEWGFGLVKSKWKLLSRKVSLKNKAIMPFMLRADPSRCISADPLWFCHQVQCLARVAPALHPIRPSLLA